MTDDFEDPSEEELREAEALAHALERGSGTDLPEDALQAAALLRYSAGDGELDQQRQSAVLDEVFATAKPQVAASAEPSPLAKLLRWLVPVGGLATAGAVALVFVVMTQSEPAPGPAPTPEIAALPSPAASLLSAQAGAASGDAEAAAELAREMGSYRQDLFAALDTRYTPGYAR